MKANTTGLLKFKRLQRALGDSLRGTTGLLELLWLETAKNAPQADIGRFTNEEIAVMCDWPGDPDLLVSALTVTGWLDIHSDPKIRLVVHDWEEHCPQYVKGNLARHNKEIYVGNLSTKSSLLKDAAIGGSSEDAASAPSQPTTSLPSQAKPIQANPTDLSGMLPDGSPETHPPTNGHTLLAAASDAPPTPSGTLTAQACEVIEFLNTKTGRDYRARHPDGTLTASGKLVTAILKRGYSVQDCKTVIARMHREWTQPDKADRMADYLRPATLFAISKFEQYHGKCVAPA